MKQTQLILFFIIIFSRINALDIATDTNNKLPVPFNPVVLGEKIYLQTDRLIYSKGEVVFFKLHLIDSQNKLQDSGIVYVDLLDKNGKLISQKIIKITDGIGFGDFTLNWLPVDDNYLIRAYTNFMRNFSEEEFARKIIHLTNKQIEKLNTGDEVKNENSTKNYLELLIDKKSFAPNEEINMDLDIYDENGEGVSANLFVSVCKEQYANKFNSANEISQKLRLENQNISALPSNDMLFKKEKSLTLSGVVTKKERDDKPILASGMITSMSDDFFVKTFQTSENGRFHLDGIDLYGDTQLIIQSEKGKKNINETLSIKGNRSVSIKIDEKDIPKFSLWDSLAVNKNLGIKTSTEVSPSDIINIIDKDEWEDGMMSEFDEITISASKINKVIAHYEKGMLYKRPDQRIITDKIDNLHQYFDIYAILAGEVTGMEITRPEKEGNKKAIVFRGYSTGLSKSTEMYNGANFMLNGAYASHNLIESIPPQNIAFIDIIKSLSKLNIYGELGVNGIIHVYLKPAVDRNKTKKKIEGTVSHLFKGYHKPLSFSTLISKSKIFPHKTTFWKPDVRVKTSGEYNLNFTAPKQIGTYQILVEGFSKEGVPVSAKYKFTVQ